MIPTGSAATLVAQQRGHLFSWSPICFGTGTGIYFALPQEPGGVLLICLFSMAVILAFLSARTNETLQPGLAAAALVLLGLSVSAFWANAKAAPVLDFRYYGAIEGRVVGVDRSMSEKTRLTLDNVVLERMAPAKTPERVRVSMHGKQGYSDPQPGMRVILTGHLSAPGEPAEPGGFDFRRYAWFDRIGAVGYTRTPVLELAPPEPGRPWLAVLRLRARVSASIQDRLSEQTGAFAAAVITGDRSGLNRETLDSMRASNLAHLLAISGLHVGLLSGFVFVLVRVGLALIPPLALRLPTKKIGAFCALLAAAAYLAVSGATVSTQRAFVMAAVMLIAVMLDRRALTLRSVAFAAWIVLLMQPDALLGPGFQMSFAATTALVWVFAQVRGWRPDWVSDWMRPIMALIISSAVAGLATAPFSAAHFNQTASYGLIANLLSVPLMGSIVIPAAVFSLLLVPVGLQDMGLFVMGLGIDWILLVSRTVAGFEGALHYVVAPQSWVLPVFSLGAFWLILFQGKARFGGAALMVAMLVVWSSVQRPDVLIDRGGGLVGALTPEGRALNKAKGQGFVARSWLENDGDGLTQQEAHELALELGVQPPFVAQLGAARLVQVSAKQAKSSELCDLAEIVVTTKRPELPLQCLVLSAQELERTGTIAVTIRDDGFDIRSVRAEQGDRLWTRNSVSEDPGEVMEDLREAAHAAGQTPPLETALAQ